VLWRHLVALATEPDAAPSSFLLRELPGQFARQTAATRAARVQEAGDW